MAVGDQQAEPGRCLVLCQGGLREGPGFGFTAPPAVLHPQYLQRPIHFPGCIPNSAVLQRMWQPWEVGGSGAYTQLTSHSTLQARGEEGGCGRGQGLRGESRGPCGRGQGLRARQRPLVLSASQPGGSQDDLWLQRRRRRRHAQWEQKLIRWLGEQESEDESEEFILDWASGSLSSQEQLYPALGSEELATQVGAGTGLRREGRGGKAGPAAAAPLRLRAFSS